MEKKQISEKDHVRHVKVWKFLVALLTPFITHKFNLKAEQCNVEGPCIIIPNHVSNWDPLIVAISFKKKQMYYVASEHIFRWGFVSKLLEYFLAPIARRKASVGSDTVMAILRHVRAGHSICIFAEGQATWNGVSNEVFSATGKMVKSSGASLVTYKTEGGYLSDPRWGKTLRKGKVKGYVVNVYSPEQLKDMTPQQINDAINADIYEDAWERQCIEKQGFKGKDLAVGMERGLFMCPECGKIGTLKTEGDRVSCNCGFNVRYTAEGLFEPAQPFENFAQWDKWQHEKLKQRDFEHGEELFGDEGIVLVKVTQDHEQQELSRGRLSITEETISCGEISFPLADISHMDMVNTHKLLFKRDKDYFEIKAENNNCLRKYLAIWSQLQV